MTTLWNAIKLIYREKFLIPDKVIDYIAVRPILIKSLSGYGNERIARSMGESILYIRSVLMEFLNFDGWNFDLDYNPIAFYNRIHGNLEWFRQEVLMVSKISNIKLIDKSFHLCRNFYEIIEKEIKKYESES